MGYHNETCGCAECRNYGQVFNPLAIHNQSCGCAICQNYPSSIPVAKSIRPASPPTPAPSMEVRESREPNSFARIVDQFLSGATPANGQPQAIILIGGPGAGKSRIRKEQLTKGYVQIDAGDVFNALGDATDVDFPGPREMPMQAIGRLIAFQAISRRLNIVLELVGNDSDAVTRVVESLRLHNYKIEIRQVACSLEVAWQRNENRGPNNISSYYAEPYHVGWLVEACRAVSPP